MIDLSHMQHYSFHLFKINDRVQQRPFLPTVTTDAFKSRDPMMCIIQKTSGGGTDFIAMWISKKTNASAVQMF